MKAFFTDLPLFVETIALISSCSMCSSKTWSPIEFEIAPIVDDEVFATSE